MITLHVFDKNRGICMPPDASPANKVDLSISWLGQAVSWCVPVMALLVLGIVVLRYGFNTGAIAASSPVRSRRICAGCHPLSPVVQPDVSKPCRKSQRKKGSEWPKQSPQTSASMSDMD